MLACRALEQLEAQEQEDEEPSWELPPELQSFQGIDGDRKALLLWRQEQQAAKQVCLLLLEFWHIETQVGSVQPV